MTGIQVAQGTLWDEATIEVALAAYDVTLASTSAGKDNSAMLAHLVARARVEGVLDRVVAVHADVSASPLGNSATSISEGTVLFLLR